MKIAASILFFLFTLTLWAAEGEKPGAVVLTGKVSDAANYESLAGAEVHIPELGVSTFCKLDGSFTFENLKPGSYSIVIKYVSYQDARYDNVEVGIKTKLHKFLLEEI